jgi:hypothetical protein
MPVPVYFLKPIVPRTSHVRALFSCLAAACALSTGMWGCEFGDDSSPGVEDRSTTDGAADYTDAASDFGDGFQTDGGLGTTGGGAGDDDDDSTSPWTTDGAGDDDDDNSGGLDGTDFPADSTGGTDNPGDTGASDGSGTDGVSDTGSTDTSGGTTGETTGETGTPCVADFDVRLDARDAAVSLAGDWQPFVREAPASPTVETAASDTDQTTDLPDEAFRVAATGSGDATVKYEVTLPGAGAYQFEWLNPVGNWVTDAPILISGALSPRTIKVNQTLTAGRPLGLGTFTFAAPVATVVLGNAANPGMDSSNPAKVISGVLRVRAACD